MNDRDEDFVIYYNQVNKKFKRLMIFQTITIIIIVLILIFTMLNSSTEGAFIDPGSGIKLDLFSNEENFVIYEVELKLENTGDKLGKISITGEVYTSEI